MQQFNGHAGTRALTMARVLLATLQCAEEDLLLHSNSQYGRRRVQERTHRLRADEREHACVLLLQLGFLSVQLVTIAQRGIPSGWQSPAR